MKHLTCRILLTTCIATLGCIPLRAAESQEAQAPNHARVCEPAVKPAFLPLPIGAIEPQAWLRDWAVSARDGITGHLDEWHPVFADGWKGRQINAPNAKPDGTGWPLEQSAYWLDGTLRLGLVLHDEALIKKMFPVTERVWESPPNDGLPNTKGITP